MDYHLGISGLPESICWYGAMGTAIRWLCNGLHSPNSAILLHDEIFCSWPNLRGFEDLIEGIIIAFKDDIKLFWRYSVELSCSFILDVFSSSLGEEKGD